MLSKGCVIKEKFQVDGIWKWFEGTVLCIRKSGQVVIQFEDGSKFQYTKKQAETLPLAEQTAPVKAKTKPTKKRKKKVFWTYELLNERVEEDPQFKSKRTKTSYKTEAKTQSLNKVMCRQAMVSDLGPKNPKLRALVLDAEDTQFSELLVTNNGVRPINIDVPNCNGPDIVEQMNNRGFATVHDSFLGDFVRATTPKTKKYDLLFLDYCGMPGGADKVNTPLHDINELFEKEFIAKRSILGLTVCIRNYAKTIMMYQNMHQMANAVISAAFSNGYLATTKMQTIYKDKGSQTMCFVCFYINKL